MEVTVKIRFDSETGECVCVIDDVGSRLPAAEHNREHERIAAEIGGVIEHPRLVELSGQVTAPVATTTTAAPEPAETETEADAGGARVTREGQSE